MEVKKRDNVLLKWFRVDTISDAIRSILLTLLILQANVLVGAGLYFGIPALKGWDRANEASTRIWEEKFPETINRLNNVAGLAEVAVAEIPETIRVYREDGHILLVNLNRKLDELTPLIRNLNGGVSDMRTMVRDTNESINHQLMPEIVATAAALKTTPATIEKAINDLVTKTNLTLDDIHTIMSDPAWKKALMNVEKTTANAAEISNSTKTTSENVAKSSAHIEEALREMPSIAKNVEKISKTTSKYAKATILVNIISTLAKAFLP